MVKKKRLLLSLAVLSLVIAVPAANAQDLHECSEQVSKKAKKLYAKGQDAFASGEFKEAKSFFLEAYQAEADFPDNLYMLGNYAFNASEYGAAKRYYLLIEKNCEGFNADIDYKLGKIAFAEENIDETVDRYRKYLASEDAKFEKRKAKNAQTDLDKVLPTYELVNNPVPFDPKPVPGVCTSDDEYLAVLSPDGKNLIYTHRFQSKGRNELVTRRVEELTASVKSNGSFSPGEAMQYPFNQGYNAGGPSITADNKQLFLTICSDLPEGGRNCDILYTKVVDGYWREPEPLPDHINDVKTWESQPSISADGKTLYFVSDRKGGFGGLDIWVCYKQQDGTWSEPKNAGPSINTKRDEKSPFIHCDSRTLYFASNGHFGLGGYDVFLSQQVDTGWTWPRNVGFPINTEKDDIGLFVSLDGKKGYFASNKVQGGPGGWDIFSFDMPESSRPDEMALVKGKVDVDLEAGLYGSNIEMRNLKTNKLEEVLVDSSSGDYLVILNKKEGSDYLLTINQQGYAYSGTHVDLNKLDEDGVMEEKLDFKKVEEGRSYELRNINFESNSANLTPGAMAVIDGFASFLQGNPNVKVTIEGHTDNVGSPAANLKLSQERAEAVVEYLKSKGISAARMRAKGFGEKKPISGNQTESGRALNRRTVFVIDQT